MKLKKCFKLNNNILMPRLGLGIHHLDEGQMAVETVEKGIACGWRFLETASSFFNEKSLGIGINHAINDGVVKREELFISTKLHDDMQGYEFTKQAFENSLQKVGVDYFDFFSIRHPLWGEPDWQTPLIDSWRALEELYKEGKIKVIGVSNFSIKYLQFLLDNAEIKPMVNQIEIHPKCQQKNIQDFCIKNNIIVSSWASLQYGKICYDKTIINIAKKYNKTPAQIVLRWHIQKNHLTVTRSTKQERLKENLDIFNFELIDSDMKIIDNMDGNATAIWPAGGIDR